MISTSNQPNSSLVKQVKLGEIIDSKKKDLKALEITLKKRISEFRELCLQEGDITGQLPIDYPLQPREPIPQIRRRQTNDIQNTTFRVQPIDTATISRQQQQQQFKHQKQYDQPTIPNNINRFNSKQIYSRPTSTNSTNSSLSVCSSSNSRSTQNRYGNQVNSPAYASSLNQASLDNSLLFNSHQDNCGQNHTTNHHLYDTPLLSSNHFEQFANKLNNDTFENDTLGYMRASSISSFSSSSGSRTSSTLSNSTLSKSSYAFPIKLHLQSYSDSLYGDDNTPSPYSRNIVSSSNELKNSVSQRQKLGNSKGINSEAGHQNDELMKMMNIKLNLESKDCLKANLHSRTLEQPRDHFNIDGIGKFQPYYEETKPFQMSDFYKYSTKHRQKIASDALKAENDKTNHQSKEGLLIEATHNNNGYSSCDDKGDDQTQASSVKLIEKSGQKLIEATAKAIVGNPGLAEKINNILPMCL